MADATPIRISLSSFQQDRFAQLDADARAIAEKKNEAVIAIIAAERDPKPMAAGSGWVIAIEPTTIVCTPPASTDAPTPDA